MTDSHRSKLTVAVAFAEKFIRAASYEIAGASAAFREDAGRELAAALRNLETYNPDINRSSIQPYEYPEAVNHDDSEPVRSRSTGVAHPEHA